MKNALFAVAAAFLFAASGCHHNLASNGCSSCGNGHAHHGGLGRGLLANRQGCNCGQGDHGHGLGGALAHRREHMDQIPRLPRHMRHGGQEVGPQGPMQGTVGYPYYTIRGPRDFLLDNPPSIGP